MSAYLYDRCKHNKGTMPAPGYTLDGTKYSISEYVRCSKRWTRPKVRLRDGCFDFDAKKGERL